MAHNNHQFNRIRALTEPELLVIRSKLAVLLSFAEDAQRRISIVNSVVTEVAASGLVAKTAILGRVVQTRPYPPASGGSDSGQIVQACLLVPGGVGLLFWDSEMFFELKDVAEGLEAEAWLHFTPFDGCEPALQALVGCHVDDLIRRFVDRFWQHMPQTGQQV